MLSVWRVVRGGGHGGVVVFGVVRFDLLCLLFCVADVAILWDCCCYSGCVIYIYFLSYETYIRNDGCEIMTFAGEMVEC